MGICLGCCCPWWRRNYRRMDPNPDGTTTTDHIVIAEDGSVAHRTAVASSSNTEASSLMPKSKFNKSNRSKPQEQSHKSTPSTSIFIEPNSNSGSGEILVRNTPGGASSYYDRPDQIASATTTVSSSSSVPNSTTNSRYQQQQQQQQQNTPLAPSTHHPTDPIAESTNATINNGCVMTLQLDSASDATLPTIQAIVNDNTTTLAYTLHSGNAVVQNIPVRMGRKNELLLRKISNDGSAGHTIAPDVIEDEVTWVLNDAPGRTITVRDDLTLGEDAGEHKELSFSEGTRILSVVNKNDVSVMVRLFHDTEEILSELLLAQADAKLTQGDGVLPRGRPGKRFKNHQFYLSIQPMRADSSAFGSPCVYNLPDSDCDVKVRIQWSQDEGLVSLLPIKKGKKSNKSTRENVSKEQLVLGKLPHSQ